MFGDKAKTLLLAYDRGNNGIKFAYTLGTVRDGKLIRPSGEIGKIPSTFVKEASSSDVKIGKNSYTIGRRALSNASGEAISPLLMNDKIGSMEVGVAYAIAKAMPEGGVCNLRLAVTSPFAAYGKGNKALVKDIYRQVKRLTADEGFYVLDKWYSVQSIETVLAVPECHIFLGIPVYENTINAAIDLGYGTLLGAYRNMRGQIMPANIVGGEQGGVKYLLDQVLRDEAFSQAMRRADINKPPNTDQIAAMLSEGRLSAKGIDFRPIIKRHAKSLKQAIQNAARAINSEFARMEHDDGTPVEPRIALIGGGSALLQAIVPADKLAEWAAKYNVIPWSNQPDYQSAIAARQYLTSAPLNTPWVKKVKETVEV